MLSSCATPEGNERGRRFFKALADSSQRFNDSTAENAARAADRPVVKPSTYSSAESVAAPTYTQTDFKCQNDCTSAGYAFNLCRKQCSY